MLLAGNSQMGNKLVQRFRGKQWNCIIRGESEETSNFRLCHLLCTYKPQYGGSWAPLVAQLVKNLPAMQKTLVGSLGQEDTLEKVMATYSSISAWRIPWTEESGRL